MIYEVRWAYWFVFCGGKLKPTKEYEEWWNAWIKTMHAEIL